MNATPEWGVGSKFFLPNEDSAVLVEALTGLEPQSRRPVFVGGSGMLLLEAAAVLPELESATFVDIAEFQITYFKDLLAAIENSSTSAELRDWFCRSVYPHLREHYKARGREFTQQQVLSALTTHFGITFFSDDSALLRVRRILSKVIAAQMDIRCYLEQQQAKHDFIYLSNVPDYLSLSAAKSVFQSCRALRAPVYLILTSACNSISEMIRTWTECGYTTHPATSRLNSMNRGLGSMTVIKEWNRPGAVWLLQPSGQEGGRP